MRLDFDNNLLKFNCSSGEGQIITEGNVIPRRQYLRHEMVDLWKKTFTKKSQIDIPKRSEFALANCDFESDRITQVIYEPRYNSTLHEESRKAVKNKPMLILNYVLDSFSRRHFFRKMP